MTTGEWIALGVAAASFINSMRKRRFEEAEWITNQYKELIDPLKVRITALETDLKDAKEQIVFLERALTTAYDKIDRYIKIIKGLYRQLVDASIEPAHTLEELEDKEL